MRLFTAKNIDMTNGRPFRLVLRFSAPLAMGSLLQQCYSLTDAAIVGNVAGVDALAAIGATSWVVWLLLAICRDSSTAFCILASVRVGGGKLEDFKRVEFNAAFAALALALAVTVPAAIYIDPVLNMMSIPENIYADARTYLMFYILSMPMLLVYNMASAMLAAAGNSRVPLYAMVASALTNIALDFLLIIGFKWGVFGAALATLLSAGTAASIALLGMRSKEPYRTRKEHRRLDLKILGAAVKLWLPLFFSSALIAAGGMFVQRSMNLLGSDFVAGRSAGNKIFNLLEAIIMALQTGVSIFAGQNLGADKIGRIRGGVREITFFSILMTTAMTGLVWLFGDEVIALFLSKSDPAAYAEAFQTGTRMIRVLASGMLLMTPMYFYRAIIQVLGYANIPIAVGAAQLVARVLAVIYLPRYLGEYTYYLIDVFAWAVSLPIVYIAYRLKIRRIERTYVAVR